MSIIDVLDYLHTHDIALSVVGADRVVALQFRRETPAAVASTACEGVITYPDFFAGLAKCQEHGAWWDKPWTELGPLEETRGMPEKSYEQLLNHVMHTAVDHAKDHRSASFMSHLRIQVDHDERTETWTITVCFDADHCMTNVAEITHEDFARCKGPKLKLYSHWGWASRPALWRKILPD